jgi:lipopolysaccharide transport system ATP-binding protein
MMYGLADLARDFIGLPPNPGALREGEFWAVNSASFDIRRGEAVGLLGANGSGKTTLLRMLAGILPPDTGSIGVRGRTGALIAVGSGFHPHMSGRENIYLNAAILGLSRQETDAQFEAIVDFAEVHEFLDTPVAAYSSGMRVRLGFAIATAIKPDLLLLDEILAVGDAGFRAKCYNRIGEMKEDTALVFVSHNTAQVARVCDRAVVLDAGGVIFDGAVDSALQKYADLTMAQSLSEAFEQVEDPVREASVHMPETQIDAGTGLNLTLTLSATEPMPKTNLRVEFCEVSGAVAAEWSSKRTGQSLSIKEGENIWSLQIDALNLRAGRYALALALNDVFGIKLLWRSYKQIKIDVRGKQGGATAYQLQGALIEGSVDAKESKANVS